MHRDARTPGDADHELLHGYSEWLDAQGLIIDDPADRRTHDDLVREYRAEQPPAGDATVAVFNYSEWLDAQQHLMVNATDDDARTHAELATEYLLTRKATQPA